MSWFKKEKEPDYGAFRVRQVDDDIFIIETYVSPYRRWTFCDYDGVRVVGYDGYHTLWEAGRVAKYSTAAEAIEKATFFKLREEEERAAYEASKEARRKKEAAFLIKEI